MEKDLNIHIESMSIKLDNISEDIREIKADLKDYKSNYHDLKLDQEKCNSYWRLVGKSLSLGGMGGAIGYLVTLIFPPRH